jgi:hypothetical protein
LIISFSKKFVFVKTRKTSGSSFQDYVSMFCDPDAGDIVTGTSEFPGYNWKNTPLMKPNGTAYGHSPITIAFDILKKHGYNATDFYKFTIERNPWDKTLSNWRYMKSINPNCENVFSKFIKNRHNIPRDWIKYTISDVVMLDDVFFYEYLNDVISVLGGNIGLDLSASEYLKYQHKKTRDNVDILDYRYSMYDSKSRKIVHDAFHHEIEEFGYGFGE